MSRYGTFFPQELLLCTFFMCKQRWQPCDGTDTLLTAVGVRNHALERGVWSPRTNRPNCPRVRWLSNKSVCCERTRNPWRELHRALQDVSLPISEYYDCVTDANAISSAPGQDHAREQNQTKPLRPTHERHLNLTCPHPESLGCCGHDATS